MWLALGTRRGVCLANGDSGDAARTIRQEEIRSVMELQGWSRSYMVGIPEACRPGSNQGNQIARTPIAARTIPVARPNGLP